MGRAKKGATVRRHPGRGPTYYARFTGPGGQRIEVSTGERDREKALEVASRLFADALAQKPVAAPKRAPRGTGPLFELTRDWLLAVDGAYTPRTIEGWSSYAMTHWHPFFKGRLERMLVPGAVAAYMRARLKSVLAKTVAKELSALRNFFGWLVESGQLAEVPDVPEVPKRALGVRSGTQREKPVVLSPEQVAAFLAELPETMPKNGYPLRARLEFMYETSLRPATLDKIAFPRHWAPGSKHLAITRDVDKARYDRTVPLTARAIELLELQVGTLRATARAAGRDLPEGLIWGKVVGRKWIVRAAKKAGVPGAAQYDLRHGRVTHALEAGADIIGVGYLAGHRQATTTSRYAHGTLRAAEAVVDKITGRK